MTMHMLVDGVRVSVDPQSVRVVATDVKVVDGRIWMTQLVWDGETRRFCFAHGEPEVDLGFPGISVDARLSLKWETAGRRLVGTRFAFVWASEHGVTVEKVEEVTGLACPVPSASPQEGLPS